MNRALIIHRAGPGVTIQDTGRPGYLAYGLSRGGAADRLALAEGAALLAQDPDHAALEMAGMGGEFEATEDMRIALTGAPMRASIYGARINWNASHLLSKGARLSIGAVEAGVYGYLHLAGGLQTPEILGAKSAHLTAGIGGPVHARDQLPVGADEGAEAAATRLEHDPRFNGGAIRMLPSLQSEFFGVSEIARFESTEFRRDTRGNRMGVRLLTDGEGFHSKAGLSVLSEVIVSGDIQITGDGTPFVLLCECGTTGGYPRIASVLPADLPRVVQAPPGSVLRFRFVTLDEAVDAERRERTRYKSLRTDVQPLIRNPHDLPDLLSYQLISGMTVGDDLERPET
jgi:biotin-dependent carboxylase-like uncharacterized protein